MKTYRDSSAANAAHISEPRANLLGLIAEEQADYDDLAALDPDEIHAWSLERRYLE